ncbi:MAG: hypothetical protein JNL74_20020 [Fibrobacteres bacterium]|nr:hypothetical protein [Fibrobacterota bacterium]
MNYTSDDIENARKRILNILFQKVEYPPDKDTGVKLIEEFYSYIGYGRPEVIITQSPLDCFKQGLKKSHCISLHNMPVNVNLLSHLKNIICLHDKPSGILIHQVYCYHFSYCFTIETIVKQAVKQLSVRQPWIQNRFQWFWAEIYDLILIDLLNVKSDLNIPNLSLLASHYCGIYPLSGMCFLIQKPNIPLRPSGSVNLNSNEVITFEDGFKIAMSPSETYDSIVSDRMDEFLCI